ncbi:type II toxin-antitoxin system VapC family toxin [Candidatus Parabeggiatoa sp. HSG14]|uniref:type II toxin-antitoxin system tRNA(fMet)-specific endonuclease VapC n=1 Tax=Candidatus Parabeggiatoa sp. HSG14 TaxID=3055593 RepID=UPI0025A6B049|nr:type II toxin-antitoxin system VapC family toxin [Thiotrichales bacterium HSG14]
MLEFMLDTDTCSYLIKQRPITVLERFEAISDEKICISVITFAELIYGVERSSSTKINLPIVKSFVSCLSVLPWDNEAAEYYGKLRVFLERKGTPIGNMDLMIAAHALSKNLTVVTNNTRHFEKIPQLQIENWVTK